MRTMLIYGATGKAGRLVMDRALERGWAVAAFVRNPNKVPAALRSNTGLSLASCSSDASARTLLSLPSPRWGTTRSM